MAIYEPITQLTPGTVQLTDVYPAVDTTDFTQAPTGTTKKYTIAQLQGTLAVASSSNRVSCKVATTAALTAVYNNGTSGVGATLTNSGAQAALVIDGVTLAVNDRVLVKDQVNQTQNGIYTVSNIGSGTTNWSMTRATDYDNGIPSEISEGSFTLISEGTTNSGAFYYQTTPGTIIVGTSNIVFATSTDGGILPLSHGGTGAALVANNGGIFYSTASAGAILSGTTTAHQVLLSGSSSVPSWSTTTYPVTTTINQLLYSPSANQISGLATANNATLVTDGSGIPSISQTLPTAVQSNITTVGTITSGTWNATIIGPTYGGTGVNNGSSTITIGGNVTFSGAFTFTGTLTGNTNVTFPTSGTLATTSQLFVWNDVTSTSATMAANNGYIADNAGLVTLTLPSTSAQGSIIEVAGKGAGGWTIVQNTGQSINLGDMSTTVTTGSLSSTNQWDSIRLVCVTADTKFVVLSAVGNITVI